MKAASVDAAQQHFSQTVASLLGTPFGEGMAPEIHAFGESNYEDGHQACVEVCPSHSHLIQGKCAQRRSEDRFFAWIVAEWPSMDRSRKRTIHCACRDQTLAILYLVAINGFVWCQVRIYVRPAVPSIRSWLGATSIPAFTTSIVEGVLATSVLLGTRQASCECLQLLSTSPSSWWCENVVFGHSSSLILPSASKRRLPP